MTVGRGLTVAVKTAKGHGCDTVSGERHGCDTHGLRCSTIPTTRCEAACAVTAVGTG